MQLDPRHWLCHSSDHFSDLGVGQMPGANFSFHETLKEREQRLEGPAACA